MPRDSAAPRADVGIEPRAHLDFDLQGDIPRYWFGGDAFKTRFFDAMSTLFPDGERFFIACVRDYRDQISDPTLQAQVKDFIFQEAQHGLQHDRYNDRLRAQGIRVDRIQENNRTAINWMRRWTPKAWTLSMTAAAEHLTAIMAHAFLGNQKLFAEADPRMRALYFWHAIEEIEHKAVAFDVMQGPAKVGYFTRVFGLIAETLAFPLSTFLIVNHMLRVDQAGSRWRLWWRGLKWLYGPGGLMMQLLPHYLEYFRPGFHPWRSGRMQAFEQWQQAYRDSGGNPIAASEATLATTA